MPLLNETTRKPMHRNESYNKAFLYISNKWRNGARKLSKGAVRYVEETPTYADEKPVSSCGRRWFIISMIGTINTSDRVYISVRQEI